MRALLALPFLVAALAATAACSSGSEDPCSIDATGVSVSPESVEALGVTSNSLNCSGSGGGNTLSCAGSATLSHAACTDGYAFTLESGNATVLIRVVGGSRVAGAKLVGGEALAGSLSLGGATSSDEPVPPSGKKQAAKFALNSGSATFDGQLFVTW